MGCKFANQLPLTALLPELGLAPFHSYLTTAVGFKEREDG